MVQQLDQVGGSLVGRLGLIRPNYDGELTSNYLLRAQCALLKCETISNIERLALKHPTKPCSLSATCGYSRNSQVFDLNQLIKYTQGTLYKYFLSTIYIYDIMIYHFQSKTPFQNLNLVAIRCSSF